MARRDWKGQTEDYLSALIYTFYFMHLDQPDAPGSPLAAYLFLLDRAKNETNRMIAHYNDAAVVDRGSFNSYSLKHYDQQLQWNVDRSLRIATALDIGFDKVGAQTFTTTTVPASIKTFTLSR